MLMIQRKVGESVVLILPDGQVATIHLRDISARKARLAIDAPKDVLVYREELLTDRQRQQYGLDDDDGLGDEESRCLHD